MTHGTLLVLHVLSAVVGFGAILVTGGYAGLARRRADETVRRYFRPGPNWAARAIYAVPVLGAALVATSHGSDRFGQLWVWVSLVLWVAATALAHAVVWPGEARIQRLLGESSGRGSDLDGASRRVERAAAAVGVVFVATVVLMVARPGGGG